MHTENGTVIEDMRMALGSVLDSCGNKWLRFTVTILKNEADAEDVLQEAVQRVLMRNQRLPNPEQLRMYLGRAIGNAALELYHRRKRERRRQMPINENLLPQANALTPYACIEERERLTNTEWMLQLLQEGLTRLPQKQHEALRLTILESRGLSIRDIGVHSGIPYSTLRHRSKQGLRMLRKFLVNRMKKMNSEARILNSEALEKKSL
jgi:RNA polymerase sigma factor (sigma-70 family)